MPINFGSSGIGEIYYGSTPIKEVYSGSQLVWSAGPPPLYTTLGASTWLTFTDSPYINSGLSGAVFYDHGESPAVSDGMLTRGRVRTDDNQLDLSNPFGMSLWIDPATGGSGPGQIARIDGTNTFLILFYSQNAGVIQVSARHGSGDSLSYVNAGTVSGLSHIAVFVSKVSGNTFRCQVYVNGAVTLNQTFDAGTQPVYGTNTAAVYPSQVSGSIYGSVDDFALFPSVLSAVDVQALYQAGRSA